LINTLNAAGKRLFRLLEEHLAAVAAVDPKAPGTISYADVHRKLGLQMMGHTYGDSLQHQGLDSLAEWTTVNSLPKLEALIVREREGTPAAGFWHANRRDEIADSLWWWKEVEKARNHDWSKYDVGMTGR
jgi:hypothetical protein